MEFITKVNLKKASWQLRLGHPVVAIGSCFAVEIGRRLRERLFDIDINPAGTLFNPSSVAATITRILDRREYTPDELVQSPDGMWHLMSHHSEFSSLDPDKVIEKANKRLLHVAKMLKEPELSLIVTFGSAKAFRYLASGEIAGNCHKLPAYDFDLVDLSLEQIVSEWDSILCRLLAENPSIKIIFTVSPVRHKAYGLVADRISKSILLLACHQLVKNHPDNTDYFPAYEIFVDELRDYRFYAADMVHPSDVGADYVFERFESAYLADDENDLRRQCLSITRRLKHRQLNESTIQSIEFETETQRQISALEVVSPHIVKVLERFKKE